MHTRSSPSARNEARVTSIRSSLFKKAAENAGPQSSSPIPGQGARIFQCAEEASELDRSLTHLTNASLELCSYGKVNKMLWTKDIFALVHNGLRHEMKDLSLVLQAMKFIRENLTLNEYKELRAWWTVFSAIVSDYFQLEEKVLLPWVSKAVEEASIPDTRASSFLASTANRSHTLRGAIMGIGKLLSILCDPLPAPLRENAPAQAKIASDIVFDMDRVMSLIADYMWEEEMQLAAVTSAHYDAKAERDSIFTRVVQHMTSDISSCASEWLVLQTRWMTDPKIAKAHTKVLTAIFDCPYSKLQTQFEMKHAAAVAVFKVKGGM
jgi:hypothetical protein